MAVTVSLYGNLRLVLDQKEIRLDWKGGTLQELIIHMAAQYGKMVTEELFDENGELDRAYALFIRGVKTDDLSVRIEDGDEVVITSMLAGG